MLKRHPLATGIFFGLISVAAGYGLGHTGLPQHLSALIFALCVGGFCLWICIGRLGAPERERASLSQRQVSRLGDPARYGAPKSSDTRDDTRYNPKQIDAMRSILLYDWEALSEGDLSAIAAAFEAASTRIMTLEGSPNEIFWRRLGTLGWAERFDVDFAPDATGLFVAYGLTENGKKMLPAFIAEKKLDLVGAAARRYFSAHAGVSAIASRRAGVSAIASRD